MRFSLKINQPAPGLVEPFGDKIRGKMGLKMFFVLERIVILTVGHGTRFEPAIENFRNPLHRSPAITGKYQFIDEMLVYVGNNRS